MFFSSVLVAQEDTVIIVAKPTNSATMIGIGNIDLYDTYLSILKYKGTSVRLMNEKMRNTSLFGGKFDKQQTIELEFSLAESSAKNSNEYWLQGSYTLGGHYKWMETDNFRFSGGALWNTTAGVLYNERNSNNPVSAKLHSNIQLSALAMYNFKQFTFRWQVDAPILGILYSPQFGQSYYEMSLGNSGRLVNFASLHNQRALRNYITVDIPINKFSFRVGYLGSYYQTKINSLKTHAYSSSLMIGLVSESINLSGSRIKKSKVKSCYYR